MTATWPESTTPCTIRMAVHTTDAEPRDGDYLTPGLNRLSRLLAAAHGGQVLLSLSTHDLARDALPRGTSLRDLGEHPLRDLHRPEQVFQLLHPDLPADFPPIRTLATRSNNLPVQPTPFLGREEQVARVVDLLRRDDVRLLTITGPGGVGKTRLALQAAADLLEDFPDGVWFVDLSVLDDPTLVPSAIAGVLGVREAGSGLTERLGGVLSGKRLLLVLDNFERVIDAAQTVSDLLARARGLKVLVTSRTPLHISGEREYPLLATLRARSGTSAVDRAVEPVRGRAPLCRAGASREARLHGDQRQRLRRGGDLLSARRPPVGDRIGRRPTSGCSHRTRCSCAWRSACRC